MKNSRSMQSIFRFGIAAVFFMVAFSAHANPIPIPEKPVTTEISSLIVISIFLEALCWVFLLRKFRTPRFFILWILGMHLLTFPGFLALLKFLDTMRPATAVALGEALVVVTEGYIVFLMSNYFPARHQSAPAPSLLRCWLVSLAGNICSAAAFPLMGLVYNFFSPLLP